MANSLEHIAQLAIKQDLSGQDIFELTGKQPIIYSHLKNFNTINDLLGKEGFCVILYQTSSRSTGHWCSIMVNKKLNEIIYFDSYGLHFDTEQQKGAKYDMPLPKYLTNLIVSDGRNYKWNQFDYQMWSPDVSTCGRWASIAVKFLKYITLSQFNQLFTTNGSSLLNRPDIAVSLLTFLTLRDVPKYFQ